MSEMSVATRINERRPSPSWQLGLTAGKIGFLLLTWSFVTQFGLPSDKPVTPVLPNESLVLRLLMSPDVNVIALRGPIEPGFFLEDAEGVSLSKVDEHDGSSTVYEIWPLQDDGNNGTIMLLEGQCDDSTTVATNVRIAYAILLILQLYILNEFRLADKMVVMALLALIQAILMIAVVANQAPDQTISLWVINN